MKTTLFAPKYTNPKLYTEISSKKITEDIWNAYLSAFHPQQTQQFT